MKTLLLICLVTMLSCSKPTDNQVQYSSITGRVAAVVDVRDVVYNPVNTCSLFYCDSLEVLLKQDTTTILKSITNNGTYQFDDIDDGNYFIEIIPTANETITSSDIAITNTSNIICSTLYIHDDSMVIPNDDTIEIVRYPNPVSISDGYAKTVIIKSNYTPTPYLKIFNQKGTYIKTVTGGTTIELDWDYTDETNMVLVSPGLYYLRYFTTNPAAVIRKNVVLLP